MSTTATLTNNAELAAISQRVLEDHLDTLGDVEASNIYRMMNDAIEKPMLEVMMRYTHGNQSQVALCMGINRATLRTKLKRHHLL